MLVGCQLTSSSVNNYEFSDCITVNWWFLLLSKVSRALRFDLRSACLSEDTINDHLPLCPLLNHLKLGYENLLSCLKIDAPNLKFLSVNGAFQNLVFIGCVKLETVDICMPQVIHNARRDELIHACILEKVLGSLASLVNLSSRCHFLKVKLSLLYVCYIVL